MVRNSLIDFGLGCVPLVGDIVDIFYKANTKNVQLMERWWVSNHKEEVDAYAKEQLAAWKAEQARLDKTEPSATQQALLKAQQEDNLK